MVPLNTTLNKINIFSIYCQELIDSNLKKKVSTRVAVIAPFLMELLTPPREIDGSILKTRCARISKSLDVLSDILTTLSSCFIEGRICNPHLHVHVGDIRHSEQISLLRVTM